MATQTTARGREKSKQQLLDAVGELLKTKGFTALKVNDIAATAGLDKKLIYNYFGSRDNLLDEYIKSLDFWSNVSRDDGPVEITDGGQEFTKAMLSQQFDYVGSNEELQKILLWGVYESRKSLRRVADDREAAGEVLLTNITDPFFGDKANNFRAAMAVVVSGLYYLNMYAGVNCDTFCGIDVTGEEGRSLIKEAVQNVVDLLYRDIKDRKEE